MKMYRRGCIMVMISVGLIRLLLRFAECIPE